MSLGRLLRVVVGCALVFAGCATSAEDENTAASDTPVSSTTAALTEVAPPISSSTTTAPPTTAPPTTAESTTAPPTIAASTTPAAASELVDLVGGGQLDFGSVEGTNTVLWFWAPW